MTVVGIYREDRGLRQLVGGEITDVTSGRHWTEWTPLCTFNGDRFDLPILERQVRLDLAEAVRDRWISCGNAAGSGLKGGLKQLGGAFRDRPAAPGA